MVPGDFPSAGEIWRQSFSGHCKRHRHAEATWQNKQAKRSTTFCICLYRADCHMSLSSWPRLGENVFARGYFCQLLYPGYRAFGLAADDIRVLSTQITQGPTPIFLVGIALSDASSVVLKPGSYGSHIRFEPKLQTCWPHLSSRLEVLPTQLLRVQRKPSIPGRSESEHAPTRSGTRLLQDTTALKEHCRHNMQNPLESCSTHCAKAAAGLQNPPETSHRTSPGPKLLSHRPYHKAVLTPLPFLLQMLLLGVQLHSQLLSLFVKGAGRGRVGTTTTEELGSHSIVPERNQCRGVSIISSSAACHLL